MKTYAVPMAYLIMDDSEVTHLEIEIVQANDINEAQTKVYNQKKAEEQEYADDNENEYVTSVWLLDEEGDEEGWIVGVPKQIS